MPNPVDSIKKAALNAMVASKPVDIVFGQVTKTNPLEIVIEQKIVLSTPMLILTRNVKDFNVEVTVDWRTENALGSHDHDVGSEEASVATEIGGDPPHTHEILPFKTGKKNLSHSHAQTGRKVMTVHNSLLAGEYVMMLRMIGGQQYVVVDRVI